jgi:hypothetical protein
MALDPELPLAVDSSARGRLARELLMMIIVVY